MYEAGGLHFCSKPYRGPVKLEIFHHALLQNTLNLQPKLRKSESNCPKPYALHPEPETLNPSSKAKTLSRIAQASVVGLGFRALRSFRVEDSRFRCFRFLKGHRDVVGLGTG